MAEAAFDLQRKIKGNTETFQDYLTQLYRWEEEIKKTDQELKKGAENFTPDHKYPIRSKIMVQEQAEKSSALGEVREIVSCQHNKQKAIIEKNKGNDYFKAGKYEEAVKCYTAAIELDSKDAVLPANRAIAYIKLNKFQEAEEDCNSSLTLDPTFVKAYHRRGTARNSLGKLDLAKKDFEKVLSLEPHNKAAQMELERVVKLIDQSASKALLDTEKNTPSEDSSILNIMDSKHQGPTKSVNYSPVVEKKAEQLSSKSYVVEEYIEPVVSTEKPKEELQQLPIVSVHNGKQEEVAVAKIIQGFAPEKDETSEVSVPKPVTEVKPDRIAPVPKTYFQFHKEWKRLQKYSDLQFQYLRQIPPSNLPDLFRDSLDTDVLGGIIHLLKNEFAPLREPILPWLMSLSRIKRIGAVAMFLSASEKSDLHGLLQLLEEKEEGKEEDRQVIRQKLM